MFTLRIVSGSVVITGEFDSWCLDSGKRVLYVTTRLAAVFRHAHIGGRYSDPNGALYAGGTHEAGLVLKDALGPTDRERYHSAMAVQRAARRLRVDHNYAVGGEVARGLLQLFGVVFMGTLKLVAFMIIFPIFLSIFHHRNR